MRKKLALALICLTAALLLAGCATVNEENSFQNMAPENVATLDAQPEPTQTPETQPAQTQPTQPASVDATPADAQPTQPAGVDATPADTQPTQDPAAPGYNG